MLPGRDAVWRSVVGGGGGGSGGWAGMGLPGTWRVEGVVVPGRWRVGGGGWEGVVVPGRGRVGLTREEAVTLWCPAAVTALALPSAAVTPAAGTAAAVLVAVTF